MMVAGFEAPTSGRILVDGEDITNLPANRRNIGMVFQNYALFPHMSVWENVAFPLKVRKYPPQKVRELVREALDLVRMTGYEHRLPRQLSGGQQQRVAVARAIVFRPSILLMDEPLGALDRKLRQEVQLELKQLQTRLGITTIYVTHDQEEALTMSDRIVILDEGRIQQVGTPDSLYRRPASMFVAQFLGGTNVLPGRVVNNSHGTVEVSVANDLIFRLNTENAVTPELTAGQQVYLILRPEHVRLEPGDGVTGLTGQILNVLYLGDVVRYELDIGNDLHIHTNVQAPREIYRVGDQVPVSWSTEDMWLVVT